jgi:L-rhamnose mutarotase
MLSESESMHPGSSVVAPSPDSPLNAVPGEKSTSQPVSPLQSPETFNAYCSRVQARLAEQARQRQVFLQSAYERLTTLMQAARAVEDMSLYSALAQQRAAAQELLSALGRPQPVTGTSAPLPPPNHTPSLRSNTYDSANGAYPGASMRGMAPSSYASPRENVGPSPIFSATHPHLPERAVVSSPVPRMPRRPVRPLESIEAEAARLRSELRVWSETHPLTRPDGSLHVSNCLLVRAYACRQRRLEEEAGDTEVAEVSDLAEDVLNLLDEAGDEEYSVALDDELESPPTAFQWGEMAERYTEMARAYEAYQWWRENEHLLTVGDLQPLVEAIAATQQRFNRLLFKIGSRDPFQQQLFDALRLWAREQQCYLHSLRPKAPIQELIERAASLEAAWEMGRAALKSVHSAVIEEGEATPVYVEESVEIAVTAETEPA